jgi:uncharacterized membrane protein YjjB (DUF3815 family)
MPVQARADPRSRTATRIGPGARPSARNAMSQAIPDRLEATVASPSELVRLVLSLARVLHVNGASTDDTLAAAGRLLGRFKLKARIIPRWGELLIESPDGSLAAVGESEPLGVHMGRVAPALRVSDDTVARRVSPQAALEALQTISQAPPAPTWLFTIAAAAGAAALSIVYGARRAPDLALIVASAAAGAVVRRTVARYSSNPLVQPISAALLAGIVGALAVRVQLSSPLRLVALCPCMILVPGPHVLNGIMDLASVRIHLGASRLVFAGLVLGAISAGLLLGMGLLGVPLPVEAPSRSIPLWRDMLAAGVAAAAFGVFYSTPPRMLGWPIAIGMLAHAVRWWLLSVVGVGVATGAFVACLLVALVLAPIARRRGVSFAAMSFASVVSMMPGAYVFRMTSGLQQLASTAGASGEHLAATVAAGVTAVDVILAMSLGLIVPKIALDRIANR